MINNLLDDIRNNIPDFYPEFGTVLGLKAKEISKVNSARVFKIKVNYKIGDKVLFLKCHDKNTNDSGDNYQRNMDANYEYTVLHSINSCFSNVEGFSIVKPLKMYKQYNAFLMEGIDVPSLHSQIKKYGSIFLANIYIQKLKKFCFLSGKWLKVFHNETRNLRQLGIGFIEKQKSIDTIRNKENLYDQLVKLSPETIEKSKIKLIKNKIIDNINSINLAGIHNKFRPEHIFIDKKNLSIIDFQVFDYGSIYEDISRFLVSLNRFLINGFFRRRFIDDLKKEFLIGYGVSEDNGLLKLFILRRYMKHYKFIITHQGGNRLSSWYQKRITNLIKDIEKIK